MGLVMDFVAGRQRDILRAVAAGGRTVEVVDSGWIAAIATLDDRHVDAIAGRWIDPLGEETGDLPRDEKPSVRKFAADIVDFARESDRAPEVILAWSR